MRTRKALLLAWFAAIIAGAAFWLGRMTTPETPQEVIAEGEQLPANSGGPAPEQSRARRADAGELEQQKLTIPVKGVERSAIQDTFNDRRGDRVHEASDIMAKRGTPVVAAADGIVKKLFTSKPGGLTVYQFDNAEQYCFYYAHLDRYADGLREGDAVRRGEVIGYVGSTGNADPAAPHLHFAIFELGPEKQWWKGTPVNPYPLLMRAAER